MNPQNQKQNPNPSDCTPTNIITTTTTNSSNTRACAACKHQRRRCDSNCPIAPFFPANKPTQDFRNVHRVFGVSNIAKTIKALQPELREAAVKSMIYQANARAADPVGGCLRIIRELQVQIHQARVELRSVLHNLAYFHTLPEDENINYHDNMNPDFSFHINYNESDVGNGGVELRVGSNIQQPLDKGFSTGSFDHNVNLLSKGNVEKEGRNHGVQRPVKLETESSSDLK